MPKKSVTQDTVDTMVRMAGMNFSLREISKAVGHAPSCVYGHLRRRGVSLNRARKTTPTPEVEIEAPTPPPATTLPPTQDILNL